MNTARDMPYVAAAATTLFVLNKSTSEKQSASPYCSIRHRMERLIVLNRTATVRKPSY
jgi:hypothetical protein